MEYDLVCGIETHVQLKMQTKLFCGCSTKFGAPPNTQVCPVCLGLPGVLPVINKEAVELAIKAGLALNCEIAGFTKFDRKHYFYPDLPKNYQISQYDLPICKNGWLDIEGGGKTKRIGIIRAHMEEDAGKLIHEEEGDSSLVDLNRTGVPLVEIVTQPDIASADEAYSYLVKLKAIMQYIGASDCDMEKGELRCDVNLSLRPAGSKTFGVKTEIKNLNSFKFASKAIAYEFRRQQKVLSEGGKITQETRLYNEDKDVTLTMRSKEEAHDYRYFPEPDLPPLVITQEWISEVKKGLPEMPEARKARFVKDYSLSDYDAGVLVADKDVAEFFEKTAALMPEKPISSIPEVNRKPDRTEVIPVRYRKAIANWIINDISRVLNDKNKTLSQTKMAPELLAELLIEIEKGSIVGAAAKSILEEIINTGELPKKIIERRGLAPISDQSQIEAIAEKVISENAKSVADYKGGKSAALGFLVGQVMKASKGKANPQLASAILEKKLKSIT